MDDGHDNGTTLDQDLEAARRLIADRIQALIRDIERCQEERELMRLHELKCQYNDVAPVARVPSEILSLVLEEYIAEHWRKYCWPYFPPLGPFTHAWFTILHVCRRWRHVALSTHRFWTQIVPTSHEYVKYAILHSGRLPLTIRHGTLKPKLDQATVVEAYKLIFKELPRFQDAKIPITPAIHTLLQSPELLELDAPMLERLNILFFSPSQDTLPALPSMTLPKLSSLTMVGGSQRILRSLLRPTLTVLDLSGLARIPVADLALLLKQLSSLRKLLLRSLFQNVLPNAMSVGQTANLPHLTHLDIWERSTGLASAWFVNYLIFPSSTAVKFATGQPPLELQPAFFSSFIPKMMSSGPQGSPVFLPRSVHLGASPARSCDFVLCSTVKTHNYQCHDQDDSDDEPRLTFQVQTHDENGAVINFFRLLDTRDVVSLSVGQPLRRETWRHIFRNMSKVENLYIYDAETAYELLEALGSPLPEDTALGVQNAAAQPPRYLFPNLKELELYSVIWRKKCGHVREGDFLPRAVELLKHRGQCGLRLMRLSIPYGWNLSEEDAELLSDPVITLHAEIDSASCLTDDQVSDSDLDTDDNNSFDENADSEGVDNI